MRSSKDPEFASVRRSAASPDALPQLSEKTFAEMARMVEAHCGIHLPPSKRLMAETRVRRRLLAAGAASFSAYLKRVQTCDQEEMVHLIDALTVNKTDFFREPAHFEYLTGYVLPELTAGRGSGARGGPVRIWSAGCSTGEEPYTLAMILNEYAAGDPGFQFSILATDICTKVLETARTAIYPLECFGPVPGQLRRKYLLRSRNPDNPVGRVEPVLRSLVEFRRLNLMDPDFGLPAKMDAIFCRNVIIYFSRETQERLIARLIGELRIGGYLFMGHSETLNTMNLPVEPVVPTVYRRCR